MDAFGQFCSARESSTDDRNVHGLNLVVGEVDQGFGCAAIHELNPKDLGIRKGDGDRDGQIGGLGLVRCGL